MAGLAVLASAGIKAALVRTLGTELPAERIRGDGRSLATVFGQAAPTRPGTQSLGTHQPLDAMQAAIDAFRQHIPPDTPGTIGSIRTKEAYPDPVADLLVVACSTAR